MGTGPNFPTLNCVTTHDVKLHIMTSVTYEFKIRLKGSRTIVSQFTCALRFWRSITNCEPNINYISQCGVSNEIMSLAIWSIWEGGKSGGNTKHSVFGKEGRTNKKRPRLTLKSLNRMMVYSLLLVASLGDGAVWGRHENSYSRRT